MAKITDISKGIYGAWQKTKGKLAIVDEGRLAGAIIYFIFGFLVFFVPHIFFHYKYFENEVINHFNSSRFLWCLACSFWGFAGIAYESSKVTNKGRSAFQSYYTTYLLLLIAISSLVFAVFNILKSTNNYLFYFISAPTAIFLSYNIDHIRTRLPDLLSGVKK
jgi:magnesium-transporting ATPase (P-type)